MQTPIYRLFSKANIDHSDDLSLNREIINFSSADSINMYTLVASTSPASTVQTSRVHPLHTGTRIPICNSTTMTPNRQDPLICGIFPKMAGLLALDQSSTEAVNQGFDRAGSELHQKEAVDRAQERETSMLLWDVDSGRFGILHPTLLDNGATTLPIEISPNPTTPSKIVISAPETHTPLLTLDLQSLALTIHAQAITALPSLYILDTLMIALLTLLLHLHRSCATPRAIPPGGGSPPSITQEEMLPYFPPPPPSIHTKGSINNLRRSHSHTSLSLFRSNKSVRSVAATSTRSALASPPAFNSGYYNSPNGHHGDRDIELGDLTPDGTSLTTTIGKQKQKAPKGMFSVDDENLPSGTRNVLKFLYWVFEVIYWILGFMVQLLAAAVVAGGKLVSKL